MDVRRCCCCHEVKPVTEFYKNLSCHDGLTYDCKQCHNKSTLKYMAKRRAKIKVEKEREEKRRYELNMGGWVIRILNHCKKGELKYSAINTNGKALITNNREKFFNYLTKEVMI